MEGMDVRFYTAANFSNELVRTQEYKKPMKFEKQLKKEELLIIDEMSNLKFNQHQIRKRHGQSCTAYDL